MNTVTETTNNTANSFEDLVALLKDAGWVAEADAAVDSGARAQIHLDGGMTEAQARVVRSIGLTRRQGVLPCWVPALDAAIWAHSATIEAWEGVLPSCYWNRGASGAYEYVSCTGNTAAAVLPDGTVRGRTRTTAARLAASPAVWAEAPPYLWEARLESLMEKHWDAIAAFRALPDGRGSQEGKDLLAIADKAMADARKIASLAMGRRAPEWQELLPDWRG